MRPPYSCSTNDLPIFYHVRVRRFKLSINNGMQFSRFTVLTALKPFAPQQRRLPCVLYCASARFIVVQFTSSSSRWIFNFIEPFAFGHPINHRAFKIYGPSFHRPSRRYIKLPHRPHGLTSIQGAITCHHAIIQGTSLMLFVLPIWHPRVSAAHFLHLTIHVGYQLWSLQTVLAP